MQNSNFVVLLTKANRFLPARPMTSNPSLARPSALLGVVLALLMMMVTPPASALGKNDVDGDGVSNKADRCPRSNQQQPTDARGCEFDSDRDGVVNLHDKCPNSEAGIPVNIGGCAHDSDNDQVTDHRDRCPNSAGNTRVDANGCPLGDTLTLPGLVFANGSSTLNRRAKSVLDRTAHTLVKYPELRIEVAGYTDSKGDRDRNRQLSQERAEAVRRYLIGLGLDRARITARGYGEVDPIASNDTAAGRATNRRVVLLLKS